MLNKAELKLISDSLSNIYDWSSDHLENDFIHLIKSEVTDIDERKLKALFSKFDSLSPLERDSISFDVEKFVEESLGL